MYCVLISPTLNTVIQKIHCKDIGIRPERLYASLLRHLFLQLCERHDPALFSHLKYNAEGNTLLKF